MAPQFIFLKKIANLTQTRLPKGAETRISSRNLHIIDYKPVARHYSKIHLIRKKEILS